VLPYHLPRPVPAAKTMPEPFAPWPWRAHPGRIAAVFLRPPVTRTPAHLEKLREFCRSGVTPALGTPGPMPMFERQREPGACARINTWRRWFAACALRP